MSTDDTIFSGGELNALGIAQTWTPESGGDVHAVTTPTQWMKVEDDGLVEQPTHEQYDSMTGTVDNDRTHRRGKGTAKGPLKTRLYTDNGYPLLVGGLGKDTFPAAVAADTTVSITTVGNLCTIVVTTGGAYRAGGIFILGTTSASEPMPIYSYDAGTKTLTTRVPEKTHSSAGTAVNQVAQSLAYPYGLSDTGKGRLLRRYCLEQNTAELFADAYPNQQVSKYDINATGGKIDVSIDMAGSDDRKRLTSPSTVDQSDATLDDEPFNFTDGEIGTMADPTNSGTSTLQMVDYAQSWQVTIDNALKEVPVVRRGVINPQMRGSRVISVNFKILNPNSSWPFWERFMNRDINIPFFAFGYQNRGTDSSPVWRAYCIYAPNVRCLPPTNPVRGMNDIIGETIQGRALKVGALERLYVSMLSARTAAI